MDRTVHRIFLFILFFSPLAFGTVEQWSLTVMEVLSLVALCLLLIQTMRPHSSRDRNPSLTYKVPGMLPLSLFLAYFIFQLIPLPALILKILSPGAHEVYSNTTWLDGSMEWGTLSLNRKATVLEFFRLLSYGAFYVVTIQLLSHKRVFKKTISWLVLYIAILALFAMIQHFTFNGKIYWVRELTQGGTPFGPYVNRNHYAGLVAMMFPLIVSLFIFYKPESRTGTLREHVLEVFNRKKSSVHILLFLGMILVAVSIFLSLSRGGIISLSLSMIFFGGVIIARMKEKKKGIVLVLIFIVILYLVGWFGWDLIFERFERIRTPQGDIAELRFDLWKDSVNIARDFPMTGAGFGSFPGIYPKYRSITTGGIAGHGHNDYIELMIDGGMIAVVLFGWFMISVLHSSFTAFMKRRDRYSIYIFIAAVTGIVAILIHSIVDFNLHIGANGLYFFFLLGLVVSAANTRFSDQSNNSYLEKINIRHVWIVTSGTVVLLLLSALYNIGTVLGNYHHSMIDRSRLDPGTPGSEITKIREASLRASRYDLLEGRYRFTYADAEWLLNNKSFALTGYRNAVRLDPLNGEYLQKLGLVMAEDGKDDMADILLRFGTVVEQQNPLRYQLYGSWLIKNGRKEDGMRNMMSAMTLEPRKAGDYITLLVLHGLNDTEIQSALPEIVLPHLKFAHYLEKTGNNEMAREEYRKVLSLDPENRSAKRMLEKLQ